MLETFGLTVNGTMIIFLFNFLLPSFLKSTAFLFHSQVRRGTPLLGPPILGVFVLKMPIFWQLIRVLHGLLMIGRGCGELVPSEGPVVFVVALQNRLATKDNLFSKNISPSFLCHHCPVKEDSNDHVLRGRSKAKNLWEDLGVDVSFFNYDLAFESWVKTNCVLPKKIHSSGISWSVIFP